MNNKDLITGQQIPETLKTRAREMRRQMTPAESRLWQHLRPNRLEGFHFRRQQIIAGYIVDFYCHAAGLVVEVDGAVHLEQEAYDRERDSRLKALSLKVIRFMNTEVDKDLETVLGVILEACQQGRDNP